MFLRNNKEMPIGCLAINIDFGLITYAWSVLNPKDKFDRKLARDIAQGRLEKALVLELKEAQVRGISNMSMHEISQMVMLHLSYNTSAPTRARKAAALWLASVPTAQ